MKYFVSILAICLVFLFVNRIFTNPIVLPIPWSDPQLLCDSVGNNLNPSFARNTYLIEGYNVLVWERDWGNRSQIYLKDFAQPDSEYTITPDSPGVHNTRPVASFINSSPATTAILIVWQSEPNGNHDLFSAVWHNGQVSSIRQITSDTADDINASLLGGDLVWERDSSIYFSHYSYSDSSWSPPTVLDSGGCCNPIIAELKVAYQKLVGNQYAIYERINWGSGNWDPPQMRSDGGDNRFPRYGNGWPINLICQYRDSSDSDWDLKIMRDGFSTPFLFSFSGEDETHPVGVDVADITKTSFLVPFFFAFQNAQSGNMEIYATDEYYNEHSLRNISQYSGEDRNPVFSEFSPIEADSLQIKIWLVWERNFNGQWQIWGSFSESDIPVSINEEEENSMVFRLYQNYPNPFNPGTVIGYQLAVSGVVQLTIYNLLGQPVKNLVKGKQPAGYYEVVWDGKDNAGREVASGVYIYRLKAGKETVSKKMLLLQ